MNGEAGPSTSSGRAAPLLTTCPFPNPRPMPYHNNRQSRPSRRPQNPVRPLRPQAYHGRTRSRQNGREWEEMRGDLKFPRLRSYPLSQTKGESLRACPVPDTGTNGGVIMVRTGGPAQPVRAEALEAHEREGRGNPFVLRLSKHTNGGANLAANGAARLPI